MNPRAAPSARAGRGRSALQLQPFDFSRDIPAGFAELDLPAGSEQGRVVAVRASPAARHQDWAAHAAVAIAGNWASRGARVLLVDLCFDEPRLHRAFNAANLEGITDAIEYGASLRRIARPANEEKFWVATAGTLVASSDGLLDRAEWRRLLAILVEGGVTVVTYQVAESPYHPRGTPSIVLACKGEPMAALGKVGLRDAVALLGPAPNGTTVTMVTGKKENRLGSQAYRDSLWDGFEDDAEAEEPTEAEAPEPTEAEAPEPARAEAEQPTKAEAESAPAAPASAHEQPADDAGPGTGSRSRGRGLSISAFAVLVLFAAVMILMGIDNAGIAEVPGADRLRELFENLLAWVSGFFAR
ncbi:MAG: CpsD/CapB family tyrosine-protein kinase [Gammaproteobacteria bacterium]|nr:CpsD/CapB family tyrosine-protein kinase [Gammaproteobacteria bacterium]